MLKVKINVMHILTMNISEMATDRTSITIAIKYEVMHGPLLRMTLVDSTGQG